MFEMNKTHTECSSDKAMSSGEHSAELTSATSLKRRMEEALAEARCAVKSMSLKHERLVKSGVAFEAAAEHPAGESESVAEN